MIPIIFIPGIEGTNLVNVNTFDFQTVWNGFSTLANSVVTSLTEPYIDEKLQLDPLYDLRIESIVERGNVSPFLYKEPLLRLKYKLKDTPIFLFGYDWRLSNMENGHRLKLFVEYLQQKLKDQKVTQFNFITHSMGGLVFSCFLKALQGNYGVIHKAALTVPPFLGAASTLVHMVKGEAGLKGILNKIIGRNEDMRKVVRTFPSVYELLPYYPDAVSYKTGGNLDLLQIEYWQSNLITPESRPLFEHRLKMLAYYRQEGCIALDKLPSDVQERILILIGEDDTTFTYIKADKKFNDTANFVDLALLKKGAATGDGTVPFVSASRYQRSIATVAFRKENFFEELSDRIDFHGLFLHDSRVAKVLTEFLNSSDKRGFLSAKKWATLADSTRLL